MPAGKCEQDITIIPFGVFNFLKKYTFHFHLLTFFITKECVIKHRGMVLTLVSM